MVLCFAIKLRRKFNFKTSEEYIHDTVLIVYSYYFYYHVVLSSEVLPVDLINGLATNQGIVEVFYGGVTGLVCGGNQWSLANAHVVCRQLGYTEAVSTTATLKTDSDIDWYWIGDVACNGNEAKLSECPSSGVGNANCSSKAMVTCGGIIRHIHIYIHTCICISYLLYFSQ